MEYAESHGIEIPNEAAEEEALLLEGVAPPSTYSGSFPGQQRRPNGTDSNGYEITGLASLIAEKLSSVDGFGFGQSAAGLADGTHLPPTQSLPTSVLYERARQAAVAKSSTHAARREGLHSTRRPWTPEEEKALMEGLDKVKGPHWSQILQLYGQNGTISDILKDRTQVQLKDKARNLKLFFLKTNSEMPYYLQCVTGELKTRAPGQAARKEAEEQARHGVMNPNQSSYAPNYTNGTTNGTYTVAHGLPMAGSSRPSSATPGAGSPPAGATNHQQYQSQPTYQQRQPAQQQQSYQQHSQQQRPPQLQQAVSHSPVTASHVKLEPGVSRPPPQPSQHHQSIAPAPSYQQRPLQQGNASTTSQHQHQQRPTQQPATQGPQYQQPQQQIQGPMATPPQPGPASTIPHPQPRSPVTTTASTAAPPRPAFAATTTPHATGMPTPSSGPATAPAPAPSSVPTIMPAPPTPTASPLTPTVGSAAASPRVPNQRRTPTFPTQPMAPAEQLKQPQAAIPTPAPAAMPAPTDPNPQANPGEGKTEADDEEALIRSLSAAINNAA